MMKLVAFGISAVLLAGCGSFAKTASIEEAYEHYYSKEYDEVLVHIIRAENFSEISPETRIELTYLKAQIYEQLGEKGKAKTVYTYLIEQHADSLYGNFAKEKLASFE